MIAGWEWIVVLVILYVVFRTVKYIIKKRTEQQQRAKGFVRWKDKWVEPEVKLYLDQTAKGLVKHNDKWGTPEQVEKWKHEEKVEAISHLVKYTENQIKELKKKDSDVYVNDINKLIDEAKENLDDKPLKEAENLVKERSQLVDRRKKLMDEFESASNRLSSLASKLADGEIDGESYRTATEELNIRKVEIQDELGEIDYKLYKEEYEKPVF